jgi:hypothetical protein
VVRFIEGNTPGYTYIGVKCFNRLCLLGTDDPTKLDTPVYDTLTSSKRKVRAWHDQQQLSMYDASTTPATLKHVTHAAVVADDNLDAYDTVAFKKRFIQVATVHVPTLLQGSSQETLDTYAAKYGFDVGINTIEIRLFDISSGIARIKTAGGKVTYLPLTRYDHSDELGPGMVPATASWKWSETDEEIWIGCDVGCCVVDAGDKGSIMAKNMKTPPKKPPMPRMTPR